MKKLRFVITLIVAASFISLSIIGVFIYRYSYVERNVIVGSFFAGIIIVLFALSIIFPAIKAVKTQNKKVLLWLLIPVVLSILILIFRDFISAFLREFAHPIIGPGGMPNKWI